MLTTMLQNGKAGRKALQNGQRLVARFIRADEGQDFAEYALILGAIAVVALAVISAYKNELLTAFQNAIAALQAANG
jgi:Flp pilus assembly pilin Flp